MRTIKVFGTIGSALLPSRLLVIDFLVRDRCQDSVLPESLGGFKGETNSLVEQSHDPTLSRRDSLTYNDAVKISAYLLPQLAKLYGLEGYDIELIEAHTGGRNIVYSCEKGGTGAKMLRIAYLKDRSREDMLAEVEDVRYLCEHGGSVADVISSQDGNLLEEITHDGHTFFVCLFERAKGRQLAENHYRYREGAPMAEYYYFISCRRAMPRSIAGMVSSINTMPNTLIS